MPLPPRLLEDARAFLSARADPSPLTSKQLASALYPEAPQTAAALLAGIRALAAALPDCASRGPAYKNRFGQTARPYLWHAPRTKSLESLEARVAALEAALARLDTDLTDVVQWVQDGAPVPQIEEPAL